MISHGACLLWGGAPAEKPDRQEWFERSVPPEARKGVAHFPLQGRSMMNLNLWDRLLMLFPKAQLRLAYWREPTPEHATALASMRPFDGVRRESIGPILDFARKGSVPQG